MTLQCDPQHDLLLKILHHCQKLFLLIQNDFHSFLPVMNHDLQAFFFKLIVVVDVHIMYFECNTYFSIG